MGLKDKLDEDLKTALRAKDDMRKSVLRMLRSELHNEEIAARGPIGEDDILNVISRQARKNRESISEFRKGGREDLAQKEEAELEILTEYLPAQLSQDDISAMALRTIQEVGASGPNDKGKVMGKLMPQVKGKADGGMVNNVVVQLLETL
jgi:hypothetical protein